MNIVQVVKRYGPVGGMERYVWELTRELATAKTIVPNSSFISRQLAHYYPELAA